MTITSKSIIVMLPGCKDYTQLFQYFLSQNMILLFRESLLSFQHCRQQLAAVSEPVIDLGLWWDRMLSCPVLLTWCPHSAKVSVVPLWIGVYVPAMTKPVNCAVYHALRMTPMCLSPPFFLGCKSPFCEAPLPLEPQQQGLPFAPFNFETTAAAGPCLAGRGWILFPFLSFKLLGLQSLCTLARILIWVIRFR